MGQRSPEDEAVIEVAKQVAGQLGVSRIDLKTVSWEGRGQSDECGFVGRNLNVLVLPKGLKGKLLPEECRPLIATAIIRSKSGGRLARRAALTRIILPSAIIGTVLTAIAIAYAREPWTLPLIEASGSVSLPVFTLYYAPEGKKLSLTIDRMGAEAVGKGRFLQTLQKIDGMSLKDVEKLKAGGLRRRFKPSITERIDNLQQP